MKQILKYLRLPAAEDRSVTIYPTFTRISSVNFIGKNSKRKIFSSVVAFIRLMILPMTRRLRITELNRWWLVQKTSAQPRG